LSLVLSEPGARPVTLVSDPVGLAASTTTGAIVAAGAGVSAVCVVAVTTTNAVGGGAFELCSAGRERICSRGASEPPETLLPWSVRS
jgi:hypothetical protein